MPPALHAPSGNTPSERVGPAGPVEAASHVETSVTQLVQQFTIRAQARVTAQATSQCLAPEAQCASVLLRTCDGRSICFPNGPLLSV